MIVLPWPDKRLSPNARLHWAAKNATRAKARQDGTNATYAAAGGLRELRARFAGDGLIPITITFYPPDRRHRDDDNMVGSFKSYRDGIADALGVNDRRFRPVYVFAEPAKPGRVEVRFLQPVEENPRVCSLVDTGDSAMKKSGPGAATTAPTHDPNACKEQFG